MIAAVKGPLRARGVDWVQVDVGGITLHISVPTSLVQELGEVGQEVRLHTRMLIKDEEPRLYGFPSSQALQFFQMLTGVSGIGPRTALNLLSSRTPGALTSAIMSEDLDAFSGIPGIGKKSAARIVLELKGKLEREPMDMPITPDGTDGDTIAALTALGYTTREARLALSAIDAGPTLDVEERVRLALGQIGRAG